MINKIGIADNSGMSFKANLVATFPVKNAEYFSKVQEGFAKATPNSPNVTMYLSKYRCASDKKDSIITHLTNIKSLSLSKDENYYEGSNLFMDNLDNLEKRFTEKGLVNYLVKRFKLMQLENAYTDKLSELREKLDILQSKLIGNKKHASVLRSSRSDFAKRYDVLADKNKQQIAQCEAEIDNIEKRFFAKANAIAKGDKELLELLKD